MIESFGQMFYQLVSNGDTEARTRNLTRTSNQLTVKKSGSPVRGSSFIPATSLHKGMILLALQRRNHPNNIA